MARGRYAVEYVTTLLRARGDSPKGARIVTVKHFAALADARALVDAIERGELDNGGSFVSRASLLEVGPGKHRSLRSVQRSVPLQPDEARLEFVDVATGEPRSPTASGTAASGRIVAEIEGTPVPVDPEDLIGRGEPADPRQRRYTFDRESPADYEAQARRRKAEKHRRAKPPRRPKIPGVHATFKSPKQAAHAFYENNAAFFDAVRDPIDGLRDWADGIDVATGRGRSRRLVATKAGAAIFAARQGQPQIEAALRWVFGQAKGRRYAAVPWHEIDRLEAALQPHHEGDGPGGLTWRPETGTLDVETLDRMDPVLRRRVRDYEAHVGLRQAIADLRESYRRTSKCIPPELRRTVLHRITAWSRWEHAPSRIPAYACEPDERSGGHLCNFPAVEGELRALRRACEEAYDPDWALSEARAGAPGFPDLSEGEPDTSPRPQPRIEVASAASAPSTKRRAKTKPQRAARPKRPPPQKAAESTPEVSPIAAPSTPVAPIAPKKPKAKTAATVPDRSELEECASMLGRRSAEVRKRKRAERLSAEERAQLLDEALTLATLR